MWPAIDRRLSRWRHAWLAKGAKRPPFAKQAGLQQRLRASGFHSQCGQDRWLVEELMPNKQHGVFVDIGAHDGQSFSNTLYLERELGWNGLAIEPLPQAFAKLQATRQCKTVQGCVAAQSGTAIFQAISGHSEMLSGLATKRDLRHEQRTARELSVHGGAVRQIEVQCFTLEELLEQHEINRVDFLDIDVEGAELSILKSFDFERFHVSVIAVENNYRDPRIPELIMDKGFEFHSIVGDEFYVNRRQVDVQHASAA